ncbi:outer membrane protein [Legionella sp. CNM-4043-24]|uniref:outer membrane protein n=1 Tax=Legionella sp. CNM-4043-24 TaxID=3421646 RepID=UPI00403AAF5E
MNRWMFLSTNVLCAGVCLAGSMGAVEPDLMHDGFFLGLGGNYNSIELTQKSWGQGISNIQTSTGSNSNGIAQGTGAPFHNTDNTFAPEVQLGYFKHFAGTDNLFGIKFSYQYLGATATNSDLYIPQTGTMVSSTGATSSLYGYVIADSVQATTSHEMSLLAFIGRSFGNKFVYLGAGPSLFNLRSKNYYSIGYADYEGVTVNVTGLVSYSSPTIWAWGGAAQLGMTYFISPTWFVDASYTYAMTGNNETPHKQAFTNSSSVGSTAYTTSGTLFTKDTMRVGTQALTLSINKVFDL